MAEYGHATYWDTRYTKYVSKLRYLGWPTRLMEGRHTFNNCRDPEPFDWYQRYAGLKELINQYVKKHDNILNVGAGNSRECKTLLTC